MNIYKILIVLFTFLFIETEISINDISCRISGIVRSNNGGYWGAKMDLFDNNNHLVDTKYTEYDGYYKFDNLRYGSYIVKIDKNSLKNGYLVSWHGGIKVSDSYSVKLDNLHCQNDTNYFSVYCGRNGHFHGDGPHH